MSFSRGFALVGALAGALVGTGERAVAGADVAGLHAVGEGRAVSADERGGCFGRCCGRGDDESGTGGGTEAEDGAAG